MIGHFLLNQQTTATAVVIIIEPVDGAGAGRLLVRTLPIRLYLGCDAPICLPLTTGSIFMTLAVELETGDVAVTVAGVGQCNQGPARAFWPLAPTRVGSPGTCAPASLANDPRSSRTCAGWR